MTQTSNIGLKKIDGSENWRNVFDYHNDSMDLADKAIAGVQAGLTYVENGDTIAANANYTAGKFIAWKGEIYRVKATINATVTSANWTTYLDKQDGIGGALSQINGDLTALNSNKTNKNEVFYSLQINSNTDLNGLTEERTYSCVDSATARTLQNCPVEAAFNMIVLSRAGNKTQIIFTIYEIYLRGQTSSGWQNWYKFTGTAVN